MNPHFRMGDILLVAPYGSKQIRIGDVVAFPNPDTQKRVVHRVVAVNIKGITTKGDNNPKVDDWVLQPQEIIGQVMAIKRQGRILLVPPRVTLSYLLFQVRQWLDRLISRLLHPFYHRLARTGLFHGWLEKRFFYFQRPEGLEWQLWLGKRLVGRKLPNQNQWIIRRPFRLFVDDSSLP